MAASYPAAVMAPGRPAAHHLRHIGYSFFIRSTDGLQPGFSRKPARTQRRVERRGNQVITGLEDALTVPD